MFGDHNRPMLYRSHTVPLGVSDPVTFSWYNISISYATVLFARPYTCKCSSQVYVNTEGN